MEGIVVDKILFRIAIMSIRSGDIHDQSRKLSKIAPNFVLFSPSQFFLGGRPSKCYTHFITQLVRKFSGSLLSKLFPGDVRKAGVIKWV